MIESHNISLRNIYFLMFLFTSIACFSCSYKPQATLFEKKERIHSTTDTLNFKNYEIQPQDILQIRNLQNKKYIVDEPATGVTAKSTGNSEGGQQYQVEDDGTVALPVIGRVKVAGLSRQQAAREIETLYRKELKDPIIELKIVNLKVTLLGEVNKQGIYNLAKDRTSLMEMIGEGGGMNEKANIKNVKIIRGGMDNPTVLEFDLSNLQTLSDRRTLLQNNDIIYVTQNKRAVNADHLKGMSAVLQPVIALLNTALIIYTLTR